MSEEKNKKEVEMLDEYDFSNGVVGKYAKQYAEGTNIVVLEPDVAKVFPDSAAVNQLFKAPFCRFLLSAGNSGVYGFRDSPVSIVIFRM